MTQSPTWLSTRLNQAGVQHVDAAAGRRPLNAAIRLVVIPPIPV